MRAATVNVGIAGLGGGASDMIPAFVQHPDIRVTAAADIDQGQLQKFRDQFDGEPYNSVAALCESPRVDVVYIATPNQYHTAHTLLALERGKHVLVEKPMTLSLADADVMIEAAARHGVQLMVNVKHSFDPYVLKLRDIVASGELGKLRMLHYWYFSDWLYRPRTAEELNPSLGGGVTWRQGPHQFDIVRTIAGGLVRSVRAMTGVWDKARQWEGSYTCYLEFQDGTPATLVYSGYGFFDTAELFNWVGEGGQHRAPETNLDVRKKLREVRTPEEEEQLKEGMRFGGKREGEYSHVWRGERKQPFFGHTVVSCQKGDIRQTPDGLKIYGETEQLEITLPAGSRGREAEVEELYNAVTNGRPVFHGGRWGTATLEVCLAMLESAKQRKEIMLSHQVPSPE
jgi:phthalate 4,5-cis-dihydrodiol dehydrogenase